MDTKELANSTKTLPAAIRKRKGRMAVRLPAPAGDEATLAVIGKAAKLGQREKRGEEVRNKVLNAALECFGAFGFDGTSTRAVADRAQVTHSLVLYHFQSKEQLWIATFENAMEAYGREVSGIFERSESMPAREGLALFIQAFVRMSANMPQIHRILTMEGNQDTPRLNYIIDNFLREHFNKVVTIIRRGQAEGSVRQCDPARLYYHIIGAGGTPFTLSTEYKAFTGRDVYSEAEILRNIAFIYELTFP